MTLVVLAAGACGDASHGTASDAGVSIDAATNDTDSGTTVQSVGCDSPVSAFPGCLEGASCLQGTTEDSSSVVSSICFPAIGLTPVAGPCSYRDMIGRCFRPTDGTWQIYYAVGGEAACAEPGQIWCTNTPRITDAAWTACQAGCDGARPDYTNARECLSSHNCVAICLELTRGRSDACGTCLGATVYWPPVSCGAFECLCPSPVFHAADTCAADCR